MKGSNKMLRGKFHFLSVATLSICAVLGFTLVCSNQLGTQMAEAYTSSNGEYPAPTSENGNLGDLYSDGAFNKAVLTSLAKSSGFNDVPSMITAAKLGNYDGATFHYLSDGTTVATNGVTVTLGGLEWIPVYLTSTNDGIPSAILDLWLANDLDTTLVEWGVYDDGASLSSYPSNMYSTSYIRAYLNGTDYADTSESLADGASVQNAVLSNFASEYGEYLISPSQVEYQELESAREVLGWNYNSPNEAYGNTSKFYENYDYYSLKGGEAYGAWSEDTFWLPSLSETGYRGTAGIWNLTTEQLAHDTTENYWLRSAYRTVYTRAYNIDQQAFYYNKHIDTAYGVRPAIHLDLDAAARSAGFEIDEDVRVPKVANPTLPYNGKMQTFNIKYLSDVVDVTAEGMVVNGSTLSAKDVGTYTVTFELNDDDYKWLDGTKEVKTAEVTITINSIDDSEVKDITFDYYGYPYSVENLKTESWWNADTFGNSSVMKIQIFNGTKAVTKIYEEGTYRIVFTLLDTKNYCWKNEEGATHTINLVVVNKMNIGGGTLGGDVSGGDGTLGGGTSGGGTLGGGDIGGGTLGGDDIGGGTIGGDDIGGGTTKQAIDFSEASDIHYDYYGYPYKVDNLKDESWWDDEIFGNSEIMQIKIFHGQSEVSSVATSGMYQIVFTLLDTDNYCWKDSDSETETLNLIVVDRMNIGGGTLSGNVGDNTDDNNGVDVGNNNVDDNTSGGDTADVGGGDEAGVGGLPTDIVTPEDNVSTLPVLLGVAGTIVGIAIVAVVIIKVTTRKKYDFKDDSKDN